MMEEHHHHHLPNAGHGDLVSSFLSYQPENRFIRRTMKTYDPSLYKPSKFVKRKNPHTRKSNNQQDDSLAFLLQRREDGRSVHTPQHIQIQRKRFSEHSKEYGQQFNIVKVRHQDNNHHLNMAIEKKQLDLLRIDRARRRNKQQGESEHHPITHRHLHNDTIKDLIPPKQMRKNVGKDTQDSSRLRESLMQYHPILIPKRPSLLPIPTSNKLLFGWGANSDLPITSRRKYAGPTLEQALALSPRAYPNRLPKNLMARRQPQVEYRNERREEIKRLRQRDAVDRAQYFENKIRQGNNRTVKRRKRKGGRGNAVSKYLLKELKESVLLLPPLTSRRG